MPLPRHASRRLLLFACTAVVAVGAAGCGDSDDGGNSAGGGSQEAQARATVDSLYAAMRESDAAGVCDTLTKPAQDQIAEGAIGSGKGKTCTDAFQQFLDAAERQGGLDLTLKAKVESVEVTGDRAVAKVSFGKSRSGEIPLVKQGDEWKLDQAGAAPAR